MKTSRGRLTAVIITGILLIVAFVLAGMAMIGHVFGDNTPLANIMNASAIGMYPRHCPWSVPG